MIDNKLISDFKRPRGVAYRVISEDGAKAQFSASPYERGFASTIGNSLRRTLLSSLSGFAIVAVKFDKSSSEYENIEGVKQDTSMICLNLKKVAIVLIGDDMKNRVLSFKVKGEKVFKAGDLKKDDQILVGNPDLVLFETNDKADFTFDLQISEGKGYVPSEVLESNIEIKGTIPLDADYSPVKRVAFTVEQTTVGNRSDFERMNMTIETKGVITPKAALSKAAQILKECFDTFSNYEEELTSAVDDERLLGRSSEGKIYNQSVHSIPVSIKTHYFFKVNNLIELGQLVTQKEADLRTRKRFDEEILIDINRALSEKSLSLDMKGVNYIATRT